MFHQPLRDLVAKQPGLLDLCAQLAKTPSDTHCTPTTDPRTGELYIPAHNSGKTIAEQLKKSVRLISFDDVMEYQLRTGHLVNPLTELGYIVYSDKLPADFGRVGSENDYPRQGDIIYVPSQMSFDHGYDDTEGGWATVQSASTQMSGGKLSAFLRCEFYPSRGYNWEILREKQTELRLRFGTRKAFLDPDYNDYDVRGEWKTL